MASENFLLQGVWKDETLVTNSSLIDNFTKWLYQLWRKFQRSPIGKKSDRRIQVKKTRYFIWMEVNQGHNLSLPNSSPFQKMLIFPNLQNTQRYGSSSHFTLTSKTIQWPPSKLQKRTNIIGKLILEHETHT